MQITFNFCGLLFILFSILHIIFAGQDNSENFAADDGIPMFDVEKVNFGKALVKISVYLYDVLGTYKVHIVPNNKEVTDCADENATPKETLTIEESDRGTVSELSFPLVKAGGNNDEKFDEKTLMSFRVGFVVCIDDGKMKTEVHPTFHKKSYKYEKLATTNKKKFKNLTEFDLGKASTMVLDHPHKFIGQADVPKKYWPEQNLLLIKKDRLKRLSELVSFSTNSDDYNMVLELKFKNSGNYEVFANPSGYGCDNLSLANQKTIKIKNIKQTAFYKYVNAFDDMKGMVICAKKEGDNVPYETLVIVKPVF